MGLAKSQEWKNKSTPRARSEKMKQYKFMILLNGLTLMLVGLLLLSYQSPTHESTQIETESYPSNPVQSMNKSITLKEGIVQTSEEIEEMTLTEEELVQKTEAFINIMMQDLDENYKVKGVSSKQELIEQYNDVVTQEALSPYLDFYFDEHNEGLYVVPTELPPWFMPDRPYEKTQLDNGNIVVEQENKLELYGRYRIRIEFSYEDDWQIIKIEHPPANSEHVDII